MRIIITGASGGLGRVLVKKLIALNHEVLATVRDKQKERKLRDAIGSVSIGKLEFIYADFTKEEEVSSISAQLERMEIDTVDVVIHNAGILYKGNFLEQSDSELLKMFQVNLFAPIKLAKELAPFIFRSRNPVMVFISSMAGVQGALKFGGLSIYGTTKAGLIGFAEQLSAEWGSKGVRVLNIAPGAIRTSMLEKAFPDHHGGLSPDDAASRIVKIIMDDSIRSPLPIEVRERSSEL